MKMQNQPDQFFHRLRRACILTLIMVAGHIELATASAQPPVAASAPLYCYPHDDLGAVYDRSSTSLKLWAPVARAVQVVLFDDPVHPASATVPMTRSAEGVWSAELRGDCDGKYYQYEITSVSAAGEPTQVRVNDPYARGCSANSGRTLIYDPATDQSRRLGRRSLCRTNQQRGCDLVRGPHS